MVKSRCAGGKRKPFRFRSQRAFGSFKDEDPGAVRTGHTHDEVCQPIPAVYFSRHERRHRAGEGGCFTSAEASATVAREQVQPVARPRGDGEVEVSIGVEVAGAQEVGIYGCFVDRSQGLKRRIGKRAGGLAPEGSGSMRKEGVDVTGEHYIAALTQR